MSSKVMIGLEIHIQLKGVKLFCSCSTESRNITDRSFTRYLYVRSGETGHIDPAALYERERDRTFTYLLTDNTCLLDVDEEPPHEINREALLRAIATSLALNCKVVDRVSYMRKIVIDGSNTSGFQRTALIGFNGWVETSRGKVHISSLCLEEDSARKINDEGENVTYSLDRLGVPLLEIATEPDIVDGDHAVETAELIGKKLIMAGWARRGPEAIRQDVNFSMGFGRVEIKGVPKLSTIRNSLKYEVQRQKSLEILSEKISGQSLDHLKFREVTGIFEKTDSKVIKRNLDNGYRIYGTILPALKGFLKNGDFRLGKELADVAKLYGSGGIMHSDELPGYGVEAELKPLVEKLKPGESDGYAILISDPKKITLIEKEMKIRLRKIASLDLSETRVISDDETTHYLRPLPGGERMYPETDVPIMPVSREMLEEAGKIIPKTEDQMIGDIVSRFGISRQDAFVIMSGGHLNELAEAFEILGNSSLASRLIIQIIPDIQKKIKGEIDFSDIVPILKLSRERNWDRQILEKALEMRFSANISLEVLGESDELKPLDAEELKIMILDIMKHEDVSPKNIIPRLRGRTSRLFDPSRALEILTSLKKSNHI
ncbi:MAG: Glu-tRNA(Gln) amidotransferase subunit GatE [Thermoplasmatales archaeon]|nr:Glu-tRNA(Gln) amidotransferase subunit GatE [Thermoplasmatales archaeon]